MWNIAQRSCQRQQSILSPSSSQTSCIIPGVRWWRVSWYALTVDVWRVHQCLHILRWTLVQDSWKLAGCSRSATVYVQLRGTPLSWPWMVWSHGSNNDPNRTRYLIISFIFFRYLLFLCSFLGLFFFLPIKQLHLKGFHLCTLFNINKPSPYPRI